MSFYSKYCYTCRKSGSMEKPTKLYFCGFCQTHKGYCKSCMLAIFDNLPGRVTSNVCKKHPNDKYYLLKNEYLKYGICLCCSMPLNKYEVYKKKICLKILYSVCSCCLEKGDGQILLDSIKRT